MELPDARIPQHRTVNRIPLEADASDIVLQDTRHPLRRMEEVPVDQQYTDQLSALLEAHGATISKQYTKTYKRRGQQWEEVQSEYIGYAITFPDGTERAYKLRMLTTAPFVIYFPDGFELHGAEVSPISVSGRPIIVLYIPKD